MRQPQPGTATPDREPGNKASPTTRPTGTTRRRRWRGPPIQCAVMGEQHPMGTMADPDELLRATKAIGAIDRMPTPDEATAMQGHAGSRELWRLACAQHLAGAVEAQVLMAAGACVDSGSESTSVLLAGWEFYVGANTGDDAARIGLLLAMARRLVDQIMLMVARKRRGEGDELLSPLVNPALAVASALAEVLSAAAIETDGEDLQPRAGLPRAVEQLRARPTCGAAARSVQGHQRLHHPGMRQLHRIAAAHPVRRARPDRRGPRRPRGRCRLVAARRAPRAAPAGRLRAVPGRRPRACARPPSSARTWPWCAPPACPTSTT